MKTILSKILTVLLCVALAAAAVGIGAVRGWSAERERALDALGDGGAMRTQLEHRGMDAANLAVVAARHLPAADADLLALRQASDTLLSDTEDVIAIMEADQTITVVAARFAASLPQLASVQGSSRDMAYIDALTGSLDKQSSLTHSYTLLTEDFNSRLSGSLLGRLAMLLGVDPLPTLAE